MTRTHSYREILSCMPEGNDQFTISFPSDEALVYIAPVCTSYHFPFNFFYVTLGFSLTIANNTPSSPHIQGAAARIVSEINQRISMHQRLTKQHAVSSIQRKFQGPVDRQFVLDNVMGSSPPAATVGVSQIGVGDDATFKIVRTSSATKVAKLTGDSPLQRLALTVDHIVLDGSTAESKSIAKFCQSFGETVVAIAAPAETDRTADNNLALVRQFIDTLGQYIMEKRGQALAKIGGLLNFSGDDPLLQDAVEQALARVVVLPLAPRIRSLLASRSDLVQADESYADNSARLRDWTQDDFEIPVSCQSPSGYAAAALELSGIDEQALPMDKLHVLVNTAQTIYRVHRHEQGDNASTLGGDDLLPIFSFVVQRAGLRTPVRTGTFLWCLTPPHLLAGELGYYLTVFDAAINVVIHAESRRLVASIHVISDYFPHGQQATDAPQAPLVDSNSLFRSQLADADDSANP